MKSSEGFISRHKSRLVWDAFILGAGAGTLVALLLAYAAGELAFAGHLNTGCNPVVWSEVVKENNDEAEDGNRSDIKIQYPDGGPVNNGALVRSVIVWDNENNWAEVGWNWRDNRHTSPRTFWARTDVDQYGEDANAGYAGDRGTWHGFKVDNNSGTRWRGIRDNDVFVTYTFDTLNDGRVYANSEVDNSCDSAAAEFRELMDKESNDASYGPWIDTRNATVFIDNPCFVTNLLSNTAFDVNHTSC